MTLHYTVLAKLTEIDKRTSKTKLNGATPLSRSHIPQPIAADKNSDKYNYLTAILHSSLDQHDNY